jgi:Protein of unknown function (DUF1566)
MNLHQFLNSLDTHKPAAQPLPPHEAQEDECDEHTRHTYALMLASVLHTRPPITEAQARVFDLLLGSLGLESIQAKLFAEAQTLEESALLEALRLLTEDCLTQVFLLDVLVLERLRGPLDEESLKLLSELADFLGITETQMHTLSGMASHILGLSTVTCNWGFAPHWVEFGQMINGRYRDHGDGTVTDTETKLHWMRCALGQSWDGSSCVNKASEIKRDAARQAAKSCTFAGYGDWRLPTLDELNTLVYCSSGKRLTNADGSWGACSGSDKQPTIDQQAFPNCPSNYFWSGTTYASDPAYAWSVNFGNGYSGANGQSSFNHVRLVRSGQ